MVRVRNRYLLCSVEFERDTGATLSRLSGRALHAAIRASLEENFGDVGSAQALPSLSVKLWSPALGLAVVRAHRDHYQLAWAAATLLTALPPAPPDNAVRVSVVHVGATIRACQKAAVRRGTALVIEQRRRNEDTARLEAALGSAKRELTEGDAS